MHRVPGLHVCSGRSRPGAIGLCRALRRRLWVQLSSPQCVYTSDDGSDRRLPSVGRWRRPTGDLQGLPGLGACVACPGLWPHVVNMAALGRHRRCGRGPGGFSSPPGEAACWLSGQLEAAPAAARAQRMRRRVKLCSTVGAPVRRRWQGGPVRSARRISGLAGGGEAGWLLHSLEHVQDLHCRARKSGTWGQARGDAAGDARAAPASQAPAYTRAEPLSVAATGAFLCLRSASQLGWQAPPPPTKMAAHCNPPEEVGSLADTKQSLFLLFDERVHVPTAFFLVH